MNNKVGIRRWLSFIVAGFVGQIAWAIENMFLNVYVYYCADKDTRFIPVMVAASAAVATITTLFMGALSDKLAKRKSFIAFGYILWGISIVAFAFFDPGSSISLVANSAFMAGTMIVVMDCVMTFFGSTANDASFNAFVTDNTEESNRGKVESVLSILPMVAMIIIVVLQGLIVHENKGWDIFFYIFGGLVFVVGVVCNFLLPKDVAQHDEKRSYFGNIFYGFRPSVIKNNAPLYITLLAFLSFSIAVQVFFPYIMVYLQNFLGLVDNDFTITFGVILVVACILTVVFGLFMDKIGKNRIIIPSLLTTAIGALLFFFARDMWFVILAGIILMTGYMVTTAVMGAKIRDHTPLDNAGSFQGIRMVFAVLLPMVSGPYIGTALFHINAEYYINEFNEKTIQPNNFMFLGAIFFLLLAIVPTVILIRKERQLNERNDAE